MPTFADVLAAPDDPSVRRAFAEAGDTDAHRLMRLQLARAEAPERWSLGAATDELEVALRLAAAPFADIENARVLRFEAGCTDAVRLESVKGRALPASAFDDPRWNTVRSLDLNTALADDAWRSPRMTQWRSIRLQREYFAHLVAGLEASGRLADSELTRLDVWDLHGTEEDWALIARLPRLTELHTQHSYAPGRYGQPAPAPPPGALDRLRALGGDLKSYASAWLGAPSITTLHWEHQGMAFEGVRAPGEKIRHVTMTPVGAWRLPEWLGSVVTHAPAHQVGGHDDDNRRVAQTVFDRMPANVETVEARPGLGVVHGARLLGGTARKHLVAAAETINAKRKVPFELVIPPPLRKKAPKGTTQ